MNEVIIAQERSSPALRMEENKLMAVLRNSLYPGAQDESIKMVIAYCKASELDPMQKPVHIVPMWDRASGSMRDVIMPGIGLYRTQAARSGQLAGITEPEFGPDATEIIGGQKITFPSWCRVTVKRRLTTGEMAEFTSCERWLENYAVKGGKEKSVAPNAMWTKRPYGQLSKCAQAQALRMSFPEMTGSAPTADEMEGKTLDSGGDVIDHETGEILNRKADVVMPKSKSETAGKAAKPESKPEMSTDKAETVKPTKQDVAKVTAGMVGVIRAKLAAQDQIDEAALCLQYEVARIEDLSADLINSVLATLHS